MKCRGSFTGHELHIEAAVQRCFHCQECGGWEAYLPSFLSCASVSSSNNSSCNRRQHTLLAGTNSKRAVRQLPPCWVPHQAYHRAQAPGQKQVCRPLGFFGPYAGISEGNLQGMAPARPLYRCCDGMSEKGATHFAGAQKSAKCAALR